MSGSAIPGLCDDERWAPGCTALLELTPCLGQHKEKRMLWTIFVVLLVLWLLGLVSSYTMGGFIHILLVVAVAVLLIQIISGRRVV
jgi:hypothetical protein